MAFEGAGTVFDLAAYDRLRTAEQVGAVVHYRERTESTMDDARAGASVDGASSGHAYVAGEQTAGRGRQGRNWVSPLGAGLHVTFDLGAWEADRAPLLSIAGGLAVADAVQSTSGLATRLKWPNDVLYGGRKIAGVLAEAVRDGGLRVFLGIGINVRATGDLPPEVARVATSIERAGAPPPPHEALLAALAAALEGWAERVQQDPAGLVEEWRGRLVTLGRRVRLATPAGDVVGEAVDVSERGELLLQLDDGRTASYAAGDVTTL